MTTSPPDDANAPQARSVTVSNTSCAARRQRADGIHPDLRRTESDGIQRADSSRAGRAWPVQRSGSGTNHFIVVQRVERSSPSPRPSPPRRGGNARCAHCNRPLVEYSSVADLVSKVTLAASSIRGSKTLPSRPLSLGERAGVRADVITVMPLFSPPSRIEKESCKKPPGDCDAAGEGCSE